MITDSSPAPGKLSVIQGKPNPHGATDSQLYLFTGDATAGPIKTVLPDECVVLPGPSRILQDKDFFLCIFHFNDLHGHLMRFTPGGEEPVFSRLVWQMKAARQKFNTDPHKAVLTLSAGDDCVGSIFDELLGSTQRDYQVHASYRLYSAAGVDAAALGNHDFDMGSHLLVQAIHREARFPILAANISGCREMDGFRFPAAILTVKGVRVGIIGLVTPAVIKLDDSQCRVVDPIPVVHNLLPALRPHCDVLIILSHLGYRLEPGIALMRDAGDVELAQSLPHGSVDLIVGGHTHHVLNQQGLSANNIVNGIPIVQAGALGRFLGRVDITIRNHVASVTNVRLMPTANLPIDQEFEQQEMQPLIAQARSLFTRSLGKVENDPNLSTDVVRNTFAAGELALANFITDAMIDRVMLAGHNVDLSMIDASCVRRGLMVDKEVTFGDWFNLMPFADTIRLYRMSGSQLYNLLQDNASRIDRPGEPHTERGFLQFSHQVCYTVELGHTCAEASADDITINSIPLIEQMEHIFTIAATSFTRELAFNWEVCTKQSIERPLMNLHALPYSETDVFLRKELVAYIQEQGGVTRAGGARLDGRLRVMRETRHPHGYN